MRNWGNNLRRKVTAAATAFLLVFGMPIGVFAQEATQEAAAVCETGCDQGSSQGDSQGSSQGGPSVEDLGGTYDESGNAVLPEGTVDTRQGANQGTAAGASQNEIDVEATNSNTGSDSTNTLDTSVSNTKDTDITNTATDTSAVDALGNTGGNTNNNNTATGKTTTGDANIGVTQVKNDNTAIVGSGDVGVSVTAQKGDTNKDVTLDFENAASLIAPDGTNKSIKAVNDATGSDSSNDIIFSFEDISDTEVQNDGKIDNTVNATAITGQNEASKNTSDGAIETGDANIAATLVNLLNTTVVNGNLMVAVKDVFGNLTGDIIIPDLAQLASILTGGGKLAVEADNSNTGSDSTNSIEVNSSEENNFSVENDADIQTNIDSTAITGQNEASKNTGGGFIDTGDASVSASNVTVANTTVEGGNWALVIVNAFNKWLGFLVGDNGEVKALSQDETINEIEARNSNTGSDSDNTITVNDTTVDNETVKNKAEIDNNITTTAITGQNTANENTGAGVIKTGDANIKATAVNIANTTVKNANLGIAVINVFGDWFGDLLYAGKSLLASATPTYQVEVEGENEQTGANSTNTIDVNADRSRTTDISNNATIGTNISTNIDTGSNKTNKNTNGGSIETGKGLLSIHNRTVANLTGIMDGGVLTVDVNGDNNGTGVESENRINARVNDERIIAVTNDANVNTSIPGLVNTGNNEASNNTVGGDIESGDIGASVVVDNIINKFIYALGAHVATGNGVSALINGDLSNAITGSQSTNSNDIDVTRAFLSTLFNQAIVDTILDLLFNTGGNVSNGNTTASSSAASQQYVAAALPSPTPSPVPSVVPAKYYVPDNSPAPYVAAVAGPVGTDDGDDSRDEPQAYVALSNPVETDEESEEITYAVATSASTSSDNSDITTPEANTHDTNPPVVDTTVPTLPRTPRRVATSNPTASRLSFAAEEVYLPVGESFESHSEEGSNRFPTVVILGTIIGTLTGGAAVRRKIA